MAHAFTLSLNRTADAQWTLETGSQAYPRIEYDNSKLTPEEKGEEHMGGRLMAAGALACYTNSLWNDIKRAGGTPISMQASVEVDKDKDSALRTVFGHYTLEVTVEAEGISDEDFDTIRSALYRGSLVTYSMEEGVEFDYDIKLVKK